MANTVQARNRQTLRLSIQIRSNVYLIHVCFCGTVTPSMVKLGLAVSTLQVSSSRTTMSCIVCLHVEKKLSIDWNPNQISPSCKNATSVYACFTLLSVSVYFGKLSNFVFHFCNLIRISIYLYRPLYLLLTLKRQNQYNKKIYLEKKCNEYIRVVHIPATSLQIER